MPPRSTIYVYGILSGKMEIPVNLLELLSSGKKIAGYNLYNHLDTLSEEEKSAIMTEAHNKLDTSLSTNV